MPLKETVTSAEIREIGLALRAARGGLVVIPIREGRRLPPCLVPNSPSGKVNRKVLDQLMARLVAIACTEAVLVGEDSHSRRKLDSRSLSCGGDGWPEYGLPAFR